MKELGSVTRFDLLPMKGQILASINLVRDEIAAILLQHFCHRLLARTLSSNRCIPSSAMLLSSDTIEPTKPATQPTSHNYEKNPT